MGSSRYSHLLVGTVRTGKGAAETLRKRRDDRATDVRCRFSGRAGERRMERGHLPRIGVPLDGTERIRIQPDRDGPEIDRHNISSSVAFSKEAAAAITCPCKSLQTHHHTGEPERLQPERFLPGH
jgi:hypothetical protein